MLVATARVATFRSWLEFIVCPIQKACLSNEPSMLSRSALNRPTALTVEVVVELSLDPSRRTDCWLVAALTVTLADFLSSSVRAIVAELIPDAASSQLDVSAVCYAQTNCAVSRSGLV